MYLLSPCLCPHCQRHLFSKVLFGGEILASILQPCGMAPMASLLFNIYVGGVQGLFQRFNWLSEGKGSNGMIDWLMS